VLFLVFVASTFSHSFVFKNFCGISLQGEIRRQEPELGVRIRTPLSAAGFGLWSLQVLLVAFAARIFLVPCFHQLLGLSRKGRNRETGVRRQELESGS